MPKLIVLESSDSPESLVQKLHQLVHAQEQELEEAELELLGLRAELDERKLEIEELRERYHRAAGLIRFALERLGGFEELEDPPDFGLLEASTRGGLG